MHKYLEKKREVNFDKIFNQMFGEQFSTMVLSLRTRWSAVSSFSVSQLTINSTD